MTTPWPYGGQVPPDSWPKPWEGPPITPVPEAYDRLVAEFPADRTGYVALLFAVVELHGPKPYSVGFDGVVWRWQCEGCDLDGYEAEPPEWPCQTTRLIAEHLGVAMLL